MRNCRAMIVKCVVYFAIFWSFLSTHGAGGIQMSKQEQLEWKKQYKLLKRPSVKTIKTKYGDIYDCVDFYNQPAFDHPLLKNHSFHHEMRPSFTPKRIKASAFSQDEEIFLDSIKLNDGGCPIGTVPIRRISKDDFIRIKRHTNNLISRTSADGVELQQPGTNFAVLQTKSNPTTTRYNGVQSYLSIHGLSLGPSQYSSGELIVQNGNDRIQVGWTVNPTLNKDNRTRLFQYLDAGESHCFNVLCPGFVSVRQDIPIDLVLEPLSIIGKKAFCIAILIYQDPNNGNWWLEFGKEGNIIGFWPQKIFTGLSESATYVAIGGQAYSKPGQPLPPMGSGYSLRESTLYCAFASNILVLDANHNFTEIRETEIYTTDNKHYDVIDEGYPKGWGRLIFYGNQFD